MCLSIPGRVVALNGPLAEVESDGGRRRWYNALPAPGLKVDDWVYTHANLVVTVVSEAEARDSIEAMRELQALELEAGPRAAIS